MYYDETNNVLTIRSIQMPPQFGDGAKRHFNGCYYFIYLRGYKDN
jgi:hypothetical protein